MVLTWEEIKMYGCDGVEYIEGNEKVFVRAFREMTEMGQKLDNEDLFTTENLTKIQGAADVSDEPFTMEEFVCAARKLYLLGELKPEPAQVEVVQTKKSTPSQQAWGEFRQFTDSHSVADCKARARTEGAYAKFLHTNLVREMGDGNVPDAVVGVGTNAVRQDKTITVTNDLRKFSEEYRHTSSAEVRRLSSPALNPHGYKLYQAKLDECIAAGLL
jgi:hypothetical protein